MTSVIVFIKSIIPDIETINNLIYVILDDVEKEISVNYSIPFIRIHKSYLVNFQQIRKVGYTEVETKDGRILNISDTYKKDVRARYSKLLWDGDV